MGVLAKNRLKQLAARLAEPGTVFYTLPLLMLLLFAGTVAQRYIGVYDAQKLFFSSFIFWLGPLPLPGGYSLTGFLSLSLLIKFLFFSGWSRDKAGINLAHFGILVLLIGGLITAMKAEEGFVVIPEGESAARVSDYHQRELVITRDNQILATIPHQQIVPGKILGRDILPFGVKVTAFCRNCRISRNEGEAAESLHGMARFMTLSPDRPLPEDEANLYGATLQVSGAGDEDGTHIIVDVMPEPIRIAQGGALYELIFQKRQRPLPFTLHLTAFAQGFHPGTGKARSFHSDLEIEDNGARWPVRIEMNKPLRYKGYTIFQSSFAETADETMTVLTVVKNGGWIFPYIGTAIIAAGLLLHTLLMATGQRQKP